MCIFSEESFYSVETFYNRYFIDIKIYFNGVQINCIDNWYGAYCRKFLFLEFELAQFFVDFGHVFRRMDNNGDRRLDRQEFMWGLKENGHTLSPSEFERIFKFFDKNNSGKIKQSSTSSTSGFVGNLSSEIKRWMSLLLLKTQRGWSRWESSSWHFASCLSTFIKRTCFCWLRLIRSSVMLTWRTAILSKRLTISQPRWSWMGACLPK